MLFLRAAEGFGHAFFWLRRLFEVGVFSVFRIGIGERIDQTMENPLPPRGAPKEFPISNDPRIEASGKTYNTDGDLRGPTWGGPTKGPSYDKVKTIESVRDLDADNFGLPNGQVDFTANPNYQPGWANEGGWLARHATKIPGMHQISIYHDYMASTFVNRMSGWQRTLQQAYGSVGTMLPAAGITYSRLTYESVPHFHNSKWYDED